jgi:cytoplasmic iron level regulating protein YaaA (DUF328/UPF0246 family)
LKILLAPSETKKEGGSLPFELSPLLFSELTPKRQELLNAYNQLIELNEFSLLSKMFGLKKENDVLRYMTPITHNPSMKAIERYTGVAFDYLAYETLQPEEQNYIDEHVLLFSNLFGVLRASDTIPDYRLKQAEPIGELKVEPFYNTLLTPLLDNYLKEEQILDLRATFYNKFYKPSTPYTTLKFVKEGKVVSHWAKAYRGIVLHHLAKANIQSLEAFMQLPIEGLEISEIQTKKNLTEIIYNIV